MGLLFGPSSALGFELDEKQFMPVDEIVPGMTGYGLSVFVGTKIDTFGVEILGVLPTAVPHGDIILARLSGHGLEKSGVIGGMSGSPVYVNGRVIGAVALGWSFSVEPIAGITPIKEMLSLSERSAGVSPAQAASPMSMSPDQWSDLWSAEGRDVFSVLLDSKQRAKRDLGPLATPLAVGGLGDEAAALLGDLTQPLGYQTMMSGSAGDAEPTGIPLKPGSALAVQLASGDASIAAVGTVTWVDGSSVYGFGHPMMGAGPTWLPMAEANILGTMARSSSSFKLGVSGASIGTLTHDYRAGVVGDLETEATTIPVTMNVRIGERTEAFHYEVVDAPGLTPALTGVLAMNTLESLGRPSGEATLSVRAGVSLVGGQSVEQTNLVAGFSPPLVLASRVARLVGLVHGNPASKVEIERVWVDAEVQEEIQASFLERIELEPGPYRPGGSVPLRIWFRNYRGENWFHDTQIEVPANAEAGTYELRAADGGQSARDDQDRAPGAFAGTSVDRVLQILSQEAPFDALVLRLLAAEANPVVGGRELPNLPGSLQQVVSTSLTSGRAGVAKKTIVSQKSERLGRLLIGNRSINVEVVGS
ncbi:MAG: hypothetical protein HKN21_07975 [Candidatus Eisenbacteria bacterium]|uniref:Peptidase S55 domain-containing protein n=1 Tax=Eiseniibacteriota bacterium TaxID=2212470 RepID=A0A7Y2H2F5_UNCEI|nr:hypothetical protein [Candidatus Eisenbacteria bacterium]